MANSIVSMGALSPLMKGICTAANGPTVPTGYACDKNDIMFSHPHSTELPVRIKWIQQFLDAANMTNSLSSIKPVSDPYPFIGLIHTPSHIASIRALQETGPAAELAVASALGAVRDVCSGTVRNAFCSIRPPGHHAHNAGSEEGFCFYSNAAIAAKYAQTACGVKNVLIIDWDYHHGNGTQFAFYSDPTVLFFSTHDCNGYPGRFNDKFTFDNTVYSIGSDPSCTGIGPGQGYNINVDMECGSGISEFEKAWTDKLIPAADSFKPDLIIISAGFDSKKLDSLGCFDLTPTGFSRLTSMAMAIADKHCQGRLVSLLEGGYADAGTSSDFNGLASCAQYHVQTLMTGIVPKDEPVFYQTHIQDRADDAGAKSVTIRHNMLYFPVPPDQPVKITIVNILGKTVFTLTKSHLLKGSFVFDQAHLPSGKYVAIVTMPDSRVLKRTFVWE